MENPAAVFHPTIYTALLARLFHVTQNGGLQINADVVVIFFQEYFPQRINYADGIYLSETSSINGAVQFSRQGTAASLFVYNNSNATTALTLKDDSVLSPVIDFSNNLSNSGLIQVR